MRVFILAVLLGLVGCDEGNMSQGALLGAHKLYNQGKYNEAISKVFRARSKYRYEHTELAELQYIMAQSHLKLRQYSKAKLIYSMIVNDYPNTLYADLSKTVLDEIATKELGL
ncbi:hypothetical protein A3740_09875 [Oleiphilus sp. HI0068]|uniref:tetratricopeptide repeat protein n=1 Tax=Oleiphilus sp. HI0132 TaxID=1822270 RepID=UPI0007C340B5|nr:tetratricopeptide repeat protein [Oleiphilus sp. HI0132]KZY77640.1 hypothetical protein A3740_09875 [Oleiphilus sp. HI0068]KZY83192.1 hypothetical protein A3741_16760 [Oleiphilus sp. HI0069]KZZ32161.1 hypothetical protein A3755_10385 [Oleiphilus sp. HI0085]KZZ75893.1 hypothetical protein A3766_15520 [Oleiphilus sp. HI0132]